MDLKQLATEMLVSKLGGNASENDVGDALGGLLGGGSGGDLDLGNIVQQLSGGDLGSAVQSWLGDGANDAISGEQIANARGSDKVGEFAQKLGIDTDQAAGGLSDLLPQLIDQNSSGGDLLGTIGGLAGKLFDR